MSSRPRLGNAVAQFSSWREITKSPSAKPEPEPDAALVECEAVIERGLKSFVEVGQALARIKDEDLYKQLGYTRFEDYCRERWDLKRSYAYETIEASQTVRSLSGIPDTHLPTNPGQARELSGLDPGEAQEVMQAAHEATQGKIGGQSNDRPLSMHAGEYYSAHVLGIFAVTAH